MTLVNRSLHRKYERLKIVAIVNEEWTAECKERMDISALRPYLSSL